MTVVNPKSISGINSITTGSGSDDILTIHNNNGTERLRVDSTGATKIVTGIVTTLTATSSAKVGSGVTLSSDGDAFFTGVCTATTFKGDGSQLSNITSTTINNNANNRVITGSGSANTLEGESELTYDSGTLNLVPSSGEARIVVIGGEGEDARISLTADDGDDHIDQYNIESRASDNSFRIDQFSGGSRVDRLSIDTEASGGNVTVHTGNLKIGTSGKGIDFSSTSDASGSSSEVLDDYEEGTFTPSISSGLSAGQVSYNSRSGHYTKIGRIVYFTFHININSAVFDDGAFKFGGLPYTSVNDTNQAGGAFFNYSTGNFGTTHTWKVVGNSTDLQAVTSAGDAVAANTTSFNTNNRQVSYSGFYRV